MKFSLLVEIVPPFSGVPKRMSVAALSIRELQRDVAYRVTPWVIDNDNSHVGEGLDGMRSIWRNNRGTSGTGHLRLSGLS